MMGYTVSAVQISANRRTAFLLAQALRSWRTIFISGVGSSRTAKSSPTLCSLLRIMITKAFIKSFSE